MLKEKAMLVSLSIAQWEARKKDKNVTDEVAQIHGVTPSVGRYWKDLLCRESVKAIDRIANRARTFHYKNTLPWNDSGERILPSAHFVEYSRQMREMKEAFEGEVKLFLDSYRVQIEKARAKLNNMFREDDYPPLSRVERKFSWDVRIMPIPNADDFRVSLGVEEEEKIKNQIAETIEIRTKEATRSLFERVHKSVSHLVQKLSGNETFRDSLVGNIIELCDLIPLLNIEGDRELDGIRRELEKSVCLLAPGDLRKREELRKEAVKRGKEIAKRTERRIT